MLIVYGKLYQKLDNRENGVFFLIFLLQKATMEQMMKTAEMFRTVCLGKIKVKTELVDELKNGKFPDDKDLKVWILFV
jgi:predicted class III extradiol MEMO1 family dioxygenase